LICCAVAVSEASVAGQFATVDFLAGSGQTIAGDAATGAIRNFFRFVTEAGPVEREFWIKNYDADIVVANGLAVLDPATLDPVEIPLFVTGDGAWIDVPVDFFLTWNDEFQVLARGTSQQTEAGFRKPYGGALFVSFFDKTPGTEGFGVEVNPLSQVLIATQRTIEIENTAGTKEIVARFRSEFGSSYFVDIPIKFLVSAPSSEICEPPFTEPCSVAYLKHETELPADCPEEASVPGEQVVAGTEGDTLAIDLLVLTVHGTTVTSTPKLRVSKWKWVENPKALIGADLEEIGSPEDYLPLVGTGTSPVESPPYEDPKRLTIAFSVLQLQTDLVAILEVQVLDGDHVSPAIPIPGPRARDVAFFPINPGGRGDGGGELCLY